MIHTLFLIVIYLLFCMLLGIRMVLIYECDTFIFFSRPQINYANLDLRQFTLSVFLFDSELLDFFLTIECIDAI